LADVGAVWCPACKNMNVVIDSLATSKDLQFHLLKIDSGEQTEICKPLKVEAFPTFIIYKGGKEVWRHSGIAEAKEWQRQLNNLNRFIFIAVKVGQCTFSFLL
jgi:thioredoxin-like negative regulator of GroEL